MTLSGGQYNSIDLYYPELNLIYILFNESAYKNETTGINSLIITFLSYSLKLRQAGQLCKFTFLMNSSWGWEPVVNIFNFILK